MNYFWWQRRPDLDMTTHLSPPQAAEQIASRLRERSFIGRRFRVETELLETGNYRLLIHYRGKRQGSAQLRGRLEPVPAGTRITGTWEMPADAIIGQLLGLGFVLVGPLFCCLPGVISTSNYPVGLAVIIFFLAECAFIFYLIEHTFHVAAKIIENAILEALAFKS